LSPKYKQLFFGEKIQESIIFQFLPIIKLTNKKAFRFLTKTGLRTKLTKLTSRQKPNKQPELSNPISKLVNT